MEKVEIVNARPLNKRGFSVEVRTSSEHAFKIGSVLSVKIYIHPHLTTDTHTHTHEYFTNIASLILPCVASI